VLFDATLQFIERAAPVHLVLGNQVGCGFFEAESIDFRCNGNTVRDRAFASAEQVAGNLFLVAMCRLFVPRAVSVVSNRVSTSAFTNLTHHLPLFRCLAILRSACLATTSMRRAVVVRIPSSPRSQRATVLAVTPTSSANFACVRLRRRRVRRTLPESMSRLTYIRYV
jgi:hypothetical protein